MKYLFLLLISFPVFARPFHVKVFSEPGAESKAQDFILQVKKVEPFKQLIEKDAFTIEAGPIVVTGLNCRGGHYGIPRLAKCELAKVSEICGDADLCPVYTSVPNIGAGGAPHPIVSSSFPWTTMLHEVVHTFGFTDEYAYTKKETETYCPAVMSWQNGYSQPQFEVYETKAEAEAACKQMIRWCGKALERGTEVVQETIDGKFKIGSPAPKKCPDVTLGVYIGGSCQTKNGQSTWRPYFCPTLMGFPEIGEDFCAVSRRHKIIFDSPNLLPDYHQEVIFQQIIKKTGQTLKFENRFKPDLRPHTYGIPALDRMAGGPGDINHCASEKEDGDWNHGK